MRNGFLSVALLGAASLSAACSNSPSASCADPDAQCTVGEAAAERGRFLGSTTGGRANWLSDQPELAPLLAEHFTSITCENELKWGFLSDARGEYDFTTADESIAFAEEHGHRVRGHTLFWTRVNGTPVWVFEALENADDPEALLIELIEEHVSTVVGRYRGRIAQWDVVNEPTAQFGGSLDPDNAFLEILGEEFLDRAFRLAHEADPDALLFLNEVFSVSPEETFQGLLDIVDGMLKRGVPIHGVGIQGHFVLDAPDAAEWAPRFEAFANLGLLVEVTELDISINNFRTASDPFEAQADAYAEVVRACLAVDACTGITTWNVHDGETWLDTSPPFDVAAPHEPTLFDANQRAKPAYFAVVEAFAEGAASP
ncbi:MAG: endo-1,4-beta-xylanase [Polyangiales bacterium]